MFIIIIIIIIINLFTFHFLHLYFPNGISPMGNSGCLPRGKPAAAESRYPTYGACWAFLCFHNPPTSNMDSRIFNVHTDVNAVDCARGCTDTRKRVCTESWLWEKNLLPHREIEPASATCRSDALPSEPHPHPGWWWWLLLSLLLENVRLIKTGRQKLERRVPANRGSTQSCILTYHRFLPSIQ